MKDVQYVIEYKYILTEEFRHGKTKIYMCVKSPRMMLSVSRFYVFYFALE